MTEAPYLSIKGISKSFGALQVVRDADIAVGRGEFVSFLGPSGCGKTTILRMVAGFETPSTGSISIDGRDITYLKPSQRNIGMVFQSYALFPNLTVADNIGFGLRVAGVNRAEIASRVEEMLALIKLPQLAERFPWQLSGGQQQRVALARALAPRPTVLLLDEPLSALDAKIRVSLREEIRAIQQDLGITTIFVTHDQEEALSMSDRVMVMNQGRIEQIGTPAEIYNHPSTSFVAGFVGTLSQLDATVTDAAQGAASVGSETIAGLPLPASVRTGDRIRLALRPESLRRDRREGDRTLSARIDSVNFLGAVIRIKLHIGDEQLSLDTFNDPTRTPPAPGDTIEVHFAPETVLALTD
ncbi:ABC transporter ATP-binding protein [Hoeflea olei]|uniref:Spermidine/putrescine ABC transporter ATP-binding protein n=1 Tax=Hoeflea olei TaxID=1480615 RepID=A0A1C1YQ17_9HYPH|nr:ABC transporter ATP-binding protein [Hoeflea olei]OCW55651.1 spermidine/putrescine ABC transporter ATP-binding protein [Hoeflea olei]